MNQQLLFVVAPYVALAVLVVGTFWRWRRARGHRAQGVTPVASIISGRAWRIGISILLAGHLVAVLVPAWILLWNRHPLRLVVLEVSGFAFACLTLASLGQGILALRRMRPRPAPGIGDLVFVTAIAVSLISGMVVALLYRWGTAWGVGVVVPYFHSVLRFSPSATAVAGLPLLARLHIVSGFAVIAALPFTGIAVTRTPRSALRRQELAA